MRFTVLIPTNDHGELIRNAIRSVLRQTVAGWNLVVVGDGAPPEMAAIVEQEAQGDNRIGYRAFPKGERHGEAWRHEVLRDATGDAVAYLGDDDFWLPDHLATLGDLLAGADLAHTRQTEIRPDGMIFFLAGSLSNDSDRRRLLLDPPWNFFGPTVAGHRLDAYRKLPAGWSPAPAGLPTDIYMWRKFLRQPGMRFAGSPMTTAIKLGAAARPGMPVPERIAESRRYFDLFLDPVAASVFEESRPAHLTYAPVSGLVAETRRRRFWKSRGLPFMAHVESFLGRVRHKLVRETVRLADQLFRRRRR